MNLFEGRNDGLYTGTLGDCRYLLERAGRTWYFVDGTGWSIPLHPLEVPKDLQPAVLSPNFKERVRAKEAVRK
jgi:hypothetical protein